jgi:hypothetical protein
LRIAVGRSLMEYCDDILSLDGHDDLAAMAAIIGDVAR